MLVLYLPINIEIEKSFERKSSLSNEEDADQYSEDEEMKDDFFSKYITTNPSTKRETSDNSSTFIISDQNSSRMSMSGKFDFSRKYRSKTDLKYFLFNEFFCLKFLASYSCDLEEIPFSTITKASF